MAINIGYFNKIKLKFTIFPYKDINGYASPCYCEPDYENDTSIIFINFRFLLLPRKFKKLILWHEYGHIMLKLNNANDPSSTTTDEYINEAMAHFYACCKCKLHFVEFNTMASFHFDKLLFKSKKVNYNDYCNYYEERYNRFNNYVDLEEKHIDDYVYQFYKDIELLIDMYEKMFNNQFRKKGRKQVEKLYSKGIITEEEYFNYKIELSVKPFDWKNFLKENGWDKNEERLKFVK